MLTFGYMFSKPVTMQYPDKEKWLPYSRYRGHHFLKRDEEGEIKCVACELCARICPCDCIEVVPYEDENGNRHPAKFEIDTARCLFCGLCEDACPADAIALGQQYEFSSFSSRDLVIGRDDLLGKPGKAMTGGGVVLPLTAYGSFGDVVRWLPSGALGEAMRAGFIDGGVAWRDLGVLIIWAVLGTTLTARTFQWE